MSHDFAALVTERNKQMRRPARLQSCVFALAAIVCLFSAPFVYGQDKSISVNMVELLANPEKFDGQVVTVFGFLTMDHQKHHPMMGAFLSLHEEDAKISCQTE